MMVVGLARLKTMREEIGLIAQTVESEMDINMKTG